MPCRRRQDKRNRLLCYRLRAPHIPLECVARLVSERALSRIARTYHDERRTRVLVRFASSTAVAS